MTAYKQEAGVVTATYTARLVGGPKAGRTLTLETFLGAVVPLKDGQYVLTSELPTVPPAGQECVYRWEPGPTSSKGRRS
jgi:hypothetical protein